MVIFLIFAQKMILDMLLNLPLKKTFSVKCQIVFLTKTKNFFLILSTFISKSKFKLSLHSISNLLAQR